MADARRSNFLATGAFVIAIAVGAFMAGAAMRQDSAVTGASPPARTAARPEPVWSQAAPAHALDRRVSDQIRVAVREELGAALAVADAQRADDAEQRAAARADELAAQSPDSQAAAARAQAIVESARRSRRWTREDAGSMRMALVRMTATQRDEVVTALIQAVNRDEIKPDHAGSIF